MKKVGGFVKYDGMQTNFFGGAQKKKGGCLVAVDERCTFAKKQIWIKVQRKQ